MDHVVYLDTKAKELANLLNGTKFMIIRGAAGRKLPYGRVNLGDVLYFVQNNASGFVEAKAVVKSVVNSEKLSPEDSTALIAKNQNKLLLSEQQLKRWNGKRYLVLIEVENVTSLTPFAIDRSAYGNMDDWLPVENIDSVR